MTTLHGLLSVQDAEFVEQAYLLVLNRKVDPTGLDYNLAKLRTGISKLTIIGDLRRSTEGRAYSPALPGLDRALRRHRLCNLPFAGWFFRGFWRSESDRAIDRHLRAIVNELGRLREVAAMQPEHVGRTDDHAKEIPASQGEIHAVMAKLGPQARRIFVRLAAQISSN